MNAFKSGKDPLTAHDLYALLEKNAKADGVQTISISGYDPFFDRIAIHWNDHKILLKPYEDILASAMPKKALSRPL